VASQETITLMRGARRIIGLFLLTIITAVSCHNFLHLLPVIGTLTGLGYLQVFGAYLKKTAHREHASPDNAEHNEQIAKVLKSSSAGDVLSKRCMNALYFSRHLQ
jgi:hypothetical protein